MGICYFDASRFNQTRTNRLGHRLAEQFISRFVEVDAILPEMFIPTGSHDDCKQVIVVET